MLTNIERLLAPLPDLPAGSNVRDDAQASALYYRVKDARSSARLAERAADAEAERGAVAPEWRIVSEITQEILANISKDIEVAVWLVEASIRLDGFAGLRVSLELLDGLIERYWPDIHGLDDEDVSTKVAAIAGLNGVGAEGSLVQPIRLAPFTAPGSGEPAGLWHYMLMRKRGADSKEGSFLTAAVRTSATPALIAIYHDIAGSLRAYTSLTKRLDELCLEDSPPSSTIRNVLEEALDAMKDVAHDALIGVGEEIERPVDQAPEPAKEAISAPAAPEQPSGPAPLRTREDALRELHRVAMFFLEHEPNSPTAYSIETVIRRARLPLTELLAELIPEDASRKIFLDMAGIRPPKTSV